MVFLQYLLGLRALGHDVFLWEQMETTGDPEKDREFIASFFDRLEDFGFRDHAALLLHEKSDAPLTLADTVVHGSDHAALREIAESADLLWNFCAALREPMLSLFRRRVLIDLDPGHLQVSALVCDMGVEDHDVFLTIGAKINDDDCEVPRLDLPWVPFIPFVYLPMWSCHPDPGPAAPFTSITHWEWGELWWGTRALSISKREAYLRYLDLPSLSARPYQLAANIHPNDATGDRELLTSKGWLLEHPYSVAASPAAYQNFIAGSRAEISCPKPIFRELASGWLSDRSACYLASGRPVLAEDTGISDCLPTGKGLLTFQTLDECLAAVAEIDANYELHSQAARAFAEEYLDSESTLSLMLAACA